MHHAALVEHVRQLVRQTFCKLGVSSPEEAEETILIRNGFYCGRRFQAGSASAIWFCEENQLKFYGEQGTVRLVIQQVDQQYLVSAPLADAA